VHPTRRCLKAAAQRHAAERSLGVAVDPALSADALAEALKRALAQKALSLLLVSARTGSLAVGAAAVERGMESTVALCLAAAGAGASAKVLAERVAERGVRVLTYGTKESLGNLFGRGEVALLGLRDARIATELCATIDRLAGVED
jgi:ribosomal protein L7Ae-like RNA K-turn-binding protein